MILLNEYFSDDHVKVARLHSDGIGYVVEFFKGEYLIGLRTYHEHTLRYVEDAAENYVEGILTEEEVRSA